MTNTQQIIDKFTSSVDIEKTYTLAELTTLLKSAYKSSGSKKADGVEKVKKAPSAYNIFIKEQMELLKNDGASPKDRMRQATANWNKRKAETKEPVVEATDSDE
ncbi:MAG: hypothetical protein EBS86_14030 [Crocinitomicaceae bacterium]|jgi:hypothetical protein|nr:hypothetical protein [Crocinitomicaceae bacterium]